jgi:hypothetical protein
VRLMKDVFGVLPSAPSAAGPKDVPWTQRHVVSHRIINHNGTTHLFAREFAASELLGLEIAARSALKFGVAFSGIVRVPLWLNSPPDGVENPAMVSFFKNNFAPGALEDLIFALCTLGIMTRVQLVSALSAAKLKHEILLPPAQEK